MTDRQGLFLAVGDTVLIEGTITDLREDRGEPNVQICITTAQEGQGVPLAYLSVSGHQVSKVVTS